MITFSGAYECKMDPKGRIVLPSRLKAKVVEGGSQRLFILQGFSNNLIIYTENLWEEKLKSFAHVSEYDSGGPNILRSLTDGMMEEELDGQGRFSLSKKLIQYAELDSDVLVVGNGKLIEIWNPDNYEKDLIKDRKQLQAMARELLDTQPKPGDNNQ